MIINHNIPSLFAHNRLSQADHEVSLSSEKLSSGERINRARDDAAGLAISEKMRSQIRGLRQAGRNVSDGISLIQTAEGYLNAITSSLQRIRELAVQSANGTYTDGDRRQIQVEVNQLIDEIDRIASQAQFNELTLLSGRFGPVSLNNPDPKGLVIHMGPNIDQRETVFISDVSASALGLHEVGKADKTPLSLSTLENANRALATVDHAINTVSRERANLGAYQNRLEFAHQAIMIGHENLQASESRIRDTDMAEESIGFTRSSILVQSATAMLAQSNLRPALVLKLLG